MGEIQKWPWSQNCMDCKNGKFVLDDENPSAYHCEVDSEDNDGSNCSKKVESEESEED